MFFGVYLESLTKGGFNLCSSADDRYRRLYKEKCAVERMCEDKQEVSRANRRSASEHGSF